MTKKIELDTLRVAGDAVVAALVTHAVKLDRGFVVGFRRPVAILVRRRGATICFRLDGGVMGRAAFEDAHRGAIGEFETRAARLQTPTVPAAREPGAAPVNNS